MIAIKKVLVATDFSDRSRLAVSRAMVVCREHGAQYKSKSEKRHLEFVRQEDSSKVTIFFRKKNLASVFGTQDFIDGVREKFYFCIPTSTLTG